MTAWLHESLWECKTLSIRAVPAESQASGFTVNAAGRAPSAPRRPDERRERQTAKVWFSKQQKNTWRENVQWGKCLHADERSRMCVCDRETERERRRTPDSDGARYSNDSSGNSLRSNLAKARWQAFTRRCAAWQRATLLYYYTDLCYQTTPLCWFLCYRNQSNLAWNGLS